MLILGGSGAGKTTLVNSVLGKYSIKGNVEVDSGDESGKSIRDMMAYLNVISNTSDSNRLKRIINIPKRGIGDRTISQVEEISMHDGKSMFEIMENAEQFDELSKSAEKINGFVKIINDMREMLENGSKISDMYEKLIKEIQYEPFIRMASDRGENAVENVHELTSSIIRYENEFKENASLRKIVL